MAHVYLLQGTEYERGWGSRPAGFLAFAFAANAQNYEAEEARRRSSGNTPDEYTKYDKYGFHPASEYMQELCVKNPAGVYIDKLEELAWSQDQRKVKYSLY